MANRVPVAVVILSGILFATAISAEESVIGLPLPDDAKRPGAIVLHGGGRITDDVFDHFVELAGGRDGTIVFVPSAGYRVADFNSEEEFRVAVLRRYSSWAGLKQAKRIRDFQLLYSDNPNDADDEDFVKLLERATGVWFSGGYQSRLNYRYVGEFPERTRFQEALRRVVSRGGVVGGTSAGTAAIPEIMTMWEGRETLASPVTAVAAHGLGLFDNAIVEQHFDARGGRLERFTRLLRNNAKLDELTQRPRSGERMVGIAVEEHSALVIRGNHLKVLGTNGVHLFLKSHGGRTLTWHELAPGDSAEIVRGVADEFKLNREEVLLQQASSQR